MWPEAARARARINGWYRCIDDPAGKIARKIRSEVDTEHLQAIDELALHHLLRSTHVDVRYEEEHGAPDFRVYSGGALLAAVEVASLFQQQEWTDDERRHNRLSAYVNNRLRPTAGYWVDFDIEVAQHDPAPKPFADFLTRQLDTLPPHEGQHRPIEAVYTSNGLVISVWFHPMSADATAKSDPATRIVATGGTVGGLVKAADRFADRVQTKAGGRYAQEAAPFAVAVGVHDLTCDQLQIHEAVYGPRPNSSSLFGIDASHPTGRHRRLAAVVTVANQRMWEDDWAEITVYTNPHANAAFPAELLPHARRVVT